jgi:hypothetical protein
MFGTRWTYHLSIFVNKGTKMTTTVFQIILAYAETLKTIVSCILLFSSGLFIGIPLLIFRPHENWAATVFSINRRARHELAPSARQGRKRLSSAWCRHMQRQSSSPRHSSSTAGYRSCPPRRSPAPCSAAEALAAATRGVDGTSITDRVDDVFIYRPTLGLLSLSAVKSVFCGGD